MTRRTTDPRTWDRIDEIFAEAIALPEAGRAAYLERACGGDADLLAEVSGLVAAHGSSGALEQLGGRIVADFEAALPGVPDPGSHVGPYRIREVLGRGGMGVVYLADRDAAGFEQRVAIKVLRAGLAEGGQLGRFLAERRILARLEHPNIPRFLDGGVTREGAPYFAMEYAEGTALDRYCDERRLALRDRLTLFLAVCDALQYAHRHLVVHRDLKPTNILVTREGVVKVLDFGIAKLLDDSDPGSALTGTGQRWMTPDYASPEQVRGDPVTTAADVFGLGVVLYELLAGCRPHTGSARHDVEHAILDLEPVRPSVACTTHAREARQLRTDCTCRELAGDLDTITLKALSKAPERRYGTAGELADDIRRHLAGLPVRARPDTLAYRVRKFVARHRRLVAAGMVAAASIVAGVITTAVAARRAQANAARAALERDRAEQVSRFVVGLFERADPTNLEGSDVTALALLDSGAARLRRELVDQPGSRAAILEALAQSYEGLARAADAQAAIAEAVALRRDEPAVDSAALAAALHRQARLYFIHGFTDSGMAPAREALALRRAMAADGALIAGDLAALGDAFLTAGVVDSAGHHLRAALRALGAEPDRGLRAQILGGLATVATHGGRMAEADSLLQAVLDLRRATLPAGHPEIAGLLQSLGFTRLRLGRLEEAKVALLEARRLYVAALGPRTMYVGSVVNLLGKVAEARGELDSAEAAFRESADILRETLGPRHRAVGRELGFLGALRLRRRDYRGAEGSLVRARAVLRGALPPGHADIVRVEVDLAAALVALRHDAEAETLLARVRSTSGSPDDAVRVARVESLLTVLRLRRAGARP